jgi:hypothetical protein
VIYNASYDLTLPNREIAFGMGSSHFR